MSEMPDPNDQEEYANVELLPMDIMDHFGVNEVTAREFLRNYEDEIRDWMLRSAWNLIEDLWDYKGQATRASEERQRASSKDEDLPPPSVD